MRLTVVPTPGYLQDIVHRDLKPENLLLSASCELKVADLGVARIEGQGGNMTAETGTYRWMAPEVSGRSGKKRMKEGWHKTSRCGKRNKKVAEVVQVAELVKVE